MARPLGKVNRGHVQTTIMRLNWHFGKGDLVRLEWDTPTTGKAITKPFRCREEKCLFRCEVRKRRGLVLLGILPQLLMLLPEHGRTTG